MSKAISTTSSPADLALPSSVITKLDFARLVAEIEQIDVAYSAMTVRKKVGTRRAEEIVVSEVLDDFLQLNNLQLDASQKQRSELLSQLRLLKDKLPVLHMTFAVSADRESLVELVQWVRQSLHPQAVLMVGLQPALVAGVYLRTPNHVYDLSLREALQGSHDVLIKELEAARG